MARFDQAAPVLQVSDVSLSMGWYSTVLGVVERTFAWLNQFRRLRVRYDGRADIHEAFLSLGCALICWQSLWRAWNTH